MKVYQVKTQTVIVRAEAADTGGICSVLEMHHPPETGAPIHVHEHEDEGFFVLEGCYRFLVGSQRVEIEQGSFLMAPRGVPHGFRCLGPREGKVLVYFTPAGAEGYFEGMSQIALDDPERKRKCGELAQRFGISTVKREA